MREPVYRFLRYMVAVAYGLLFSVQVQGRRELPQGGCLVVANHFSAWDPPLVGVVFPRTLHYMAKEELFRIPFLGTVLRWVGAFPVRRDGRDRQALRRALRLLEEGQAVVMFPEGTRFKRDQEGRPGKAQPWAALLALKAGVPVVPVAIRGQYRFRGGIHVAIGEPFYLAPGMAPKEREHLAQVADGEIMDRIRALWDQAV
ncbi:MAG: lysophospholipid acyltransferase family protein [Bacillota bacterium]|nr:lysophospholipid acyltransferase family protein [Bacillota bacterium]